MPVIQAAERQCLAGRLCDALVVRCFGNPTCIRTDRVFDAADDDRTERLHSNDETSRDASANGHGECW